MTRDQTIIVNPWSGRAKTAGKLHTGILFPLVQAPAGRPARSKICQPNVPPRCHPAPSTHAIRISPRGLLASLYAEEGKYTQSEVLNRQALETRRRVLGPENPETLMSMDNLACAYAWRKKYSQAESLFAQTLETERRVLGPKSRLTLDALSNAAFLYQLERKYAQAELYAGEVLDAWQRALGTDSPVTMGAAADLALAYLSQGKFAAGERLAREALEFNQKRQPDDWQRFRAESLLGASLAGQKKYAEAEPLLREGYQGMEARKDRMGAPERYHIDRARDWLAQLHNALDKRKRVQDSTALRSVVR